MFAEEVAEQNLVPDVGPPLDSFPGSLVSWLCLAEALPSFPLTGSDD